MSLFLVFFSALSKSMSAFKARRAKRAKCVFGSRFLDIDQYMCMSLVEWSLRASTRNMLLAVEVFRFEKKKKKKKRTPLPYFSSPPFVRDIGSQIYWKEALIHLCKHGFWPRAGPSAVAFVGNMICPLAPVSCVPDSFSKPLKVVGGWQSGGGVLVRLGHESEHVVRSVRTLTPSVSPVEGFVCIAAGVSFFFMRVC